MDGTGGETDPAVRAVFVVVGAHRSEVALVVLLRK